MNMIFSSRTHPTLATVTVNQWTQRTRSLIGWRRRHGGSVYKTPSLQTYTVIVRMTSRFPESRNCWIYWIRTAGHCDITVMALWCRCYCMAVNYSVCHLSGQPVTYLASIQSRHSYSPSLWYYLVHTACKRISQSVIRSYFNLIYQNHPFFK